MPTSNFDCTAAEFTFDGPYADTSSGSNYRRMDSSFGQCRVTVTGTACALSSFGLGGAVDIVVDGVSTTLTPSGSGAWTPTLFTGLADAAHTLTIRPHAGGDLYLESNTNNKTLQLTGAAPAVSASATYSDRLPIYADLHSGSPKSVADGLTGFGSSSGYNFLEYAYQGNFAGLGAIRFRAKCSQIDIWGYRGGANGSPQFRLYIDGSPQTPFAVPIDGTVSWGLFPSITGLDASDFHEYSIVSDDAGKYHDIYEVYLTGGTGLDPTYTPATRPLVAIMGDSIAAGALTTPTNGYFAAFARARGAGAVNAGVSSSTVATPNSSMAARTIWITQFGSAVSEIIFCGGVNDILIGNTVGDYATAYASTLASLLSGCTAAAIWCLGILPNGDGSSPSETIATFNAAAHATVVANGSTRLKWIDPAPWATTLAPGGDYDRYYAADHLHPNALGHSLVYSLLESAIRAASGPAPRIGSNLIGGI